MWSAVSIVVLAAVMLVVSALSAPRVSDSENAGMGASPQLEQLLREAESALASGDTTRGVDLARRVLVIDPGNERAKALTLADATSTDSRGETPSETTPDGGDESPVAADAFARPMENIAGLLPTEFEGYSMSYVAKVKGDANVSGLPEQPGSPAFRIAWTVRDAGSAKKARSFIAKTSMVLFPKSADDSLSVDGAKAYFGTDGVELASVAYYRGRHVFEVVVVAESRGGPERLRALAVDAARAFADTPVE